MPNHKPARLRHSGGES